MRFLINDNNGGFRLSETFDKDMPRYAILSHTWRADKGDVTYKDMINGTAKDQPGYDKIRFCGEQAAQDGLQYFWVNSCCVDQPNNVELSEAINSMFRWYENAAKCYVYLSDVPRPDLEADAEYYQQAWKTCFRQSRWFTRGWTLQELLAPAWVQFFSRDGESLGTKKSLEWQIHEISGIPIRALQGHPLAYFSVDERLSWADIRETTKAEDKAYSLFSIFGAVMPVIYGEGRLHAFKRLRNEIHTKNLPQGQAVEQSIRSTVEDRSGEFQYEDH